MDGGRGDVGILTAAGNGQTLCPNCGTPLQGRFCHACGQKRIEPEERRFAWFVREFVRAVTLADSRLLRSLGRLIFRPGSLDRDWLEGRRRRNVAPLSLFLMANLVYFFHPPLSDLNLSLFDQTAQFGYGPFVASLAEARVAARETTMNAYAAVYAARTAAVAKVMVILHVPLLAAVLALLHYRRRVFYVDHLAVALHFWAFLLLHAMVTPAVVAWIHHLAGVGSRASFQFIMAAIAIAYAFLQLRGAYGQPRRLAALKIPVFIIGLAVAHFVYRFVQFVLVFAVT
jgi:hypothetical protein